jgi:8-oxo-dGTP diphosphatase
MSEWSAPAVGVSVIIFRDATAQEVLLVERGKDPLKGYWSPPGGRLELGETIIDAAAREVREECDLSLHIEPDGAYNAVDAIIRNETGGVSFHFVLIQVVAIAAADAVPVAGDDAAAVRWVAVRDLAQLQPHVDELINVVASAKRHLAARAIVVE